MGFKFWFIDRVFINTFINGHPKMLETAQNRGFCPASQVLQYLRVLVAQNAAPLHQQVRCLSLETMCGEDERNFGNVYCVFGGFLVLISQFPSTLFKKSS
jgi:hypothetical protein